MKLSINRIGTLLISASLLSAMACTKQASQQPEKNSTMTDARPDLSNQPTPPAAAQDQATPANANVNAGDTQGAVTTNPNSARDTTDSTINTSAGAAVVGGTNMNPRDESGKPTSTDSAPNVEPKTDAAVDNVNCRDSVANDYNGKTAGKTNDCPPTSESPLNRESTQGQVTR